MPHVIVRLFAGRSEQEKSRLAQELPQAVMRTFGSGEESVSVIQQSDKRVIAQSGRRRLHTWRSASFCSRADPRTTAPALNARNPRRVANESSDLKAGSVQVRHD